MRLTKRKSLLTILLALAAFAAGPALAAQAATGIDGFTILYADSGNMAHKCKVFGASGGYQAVACADITTGTDSTTQYHATGTMELYCQTTAGVTVKCDAMIAEGVFSDGGGYQKDAGEYICNGNCPSGREYLTDGTFSYSTSLGASVCDTSLTYSVWEVAYGGTSWVELPNGAYEYLGSNWETGHYLICPY